MLIAQAEPREPRLRRQVQRPDYVYANGVDSDASKLFSSVFFFSWFANHHIQDDADEYVFQEDDDYEDQLDEDEYLNSRSDAPSGSRRSRVSAVPARRSARNAALNANGKRETPDTWSQWRGERRSTRLGAPFDAQLDAVPPKRARTEESATSTNSVAPVGEINESKANGSAAGEPTKIPVEVPGRKRSKFWYYVVQPKPDPPSAPSGKDKESTNFGGKDDDAGSIPPDTYIANERENNFTPSSNASVDSCSYD
jgi:hypothetical protein